MTFYLKYRPQKIDDLDLEDVREKLTKIVKSGEVPHALLFSGPKGSGKTSAARIVAKIVNCERRKGKNPPAGGEPCNKCEQCVSITKGNNIEVVELDAASHRGIDDVRTLRDAVKLAPARASKKVYIIDEAHMLTLEASNALLKTLEEPPKHVIFILATTNPEKLIETIRSRCLNINFKKASVDEIVRSLSGVSKGEKLKVSKASLSAIAKASDGSFRDAVKILEEISMNLKRMDDGAVEEYLSSKSVFDIDVFLEYLCKKDAKKSFSLIESTVAKGVSVKAISEKLIRRLREAFLVKIGMEGNDLGIFSKTEVLSLIKLFSKSFEEVSESIIDQLPLEIAIAQWCEIDLKEKGDKGKADGSRDGIADKSLDEIVAESKTESKTKEKKTSGKVDKLGNNKISDEIWAKILSKVRPLNTSTEALLRAARPMNYDGSTLKLGVFYRFHKERLEMREHRNLLEDVASEILGNGVKIICSLTDQPKKVEVEEENTNALSETEDGDIVKVAKEIFGS